jgi:hypothetical protein
MASQIDWRREIAARAKAAGVTLPEATIEEIAEHLDEIYAAAVRSGANHADARRRARMAIDESRFDVLRGHSVHPVAPSSTPFVAAPAHRP